MLSHSLVIGYHGCDRSLVERVVGGKKDLKPSQNTWDWLGHGIYFWEDSHERALRWAKEPPRRHGNRINTAGVLGAIIDLGNCLNLTDASALSLVKSAYQTYMEACVTSGAIPAKNHGPKLVIRDLDCAVMETLHELRQRERKQPLQPFDTVRGFFLEGQALYDTAGFRELDHIQICVRSPKQIIGYFLPRGNI